MEPPSIRFTCAARRRTPSPPPSSSESSTRPGGGSRRARPRSPAPRAPPARAPAATDRHEREAQKLGALRRGAVVHPNPGCVEVGAQVVGAVRGLEARPVAAGLILLLGDALLHPGQPVGIASGTAVPASPSAARSGISRQRRRMQAIPFDTSAKSRRLGAATLLMAPSPDSPSTLPDTALAWSPRAPSRGSHFLLTRWAATPRLSKPRTV